MVILGQLGVDVKLLVAQLVNFGLLLWLLQKFLYKPVIKRIEKDEKEMNEVRREKQLLDKNKVSLVEQKTKEMKEAHEKAGKIISEAEVMAGHIKQRAQKEAAEEKAATIKQIHTRLKELEDDEGAG